MLCAGLTIRILRNSRVFVILWSIKKICLWLILMILLGEALSFVNET